MKPLIVIKSCERYADRREAVRQTWLTLLPSRFSYIFVMGMSSVITTEPDVLFLPVSDAFKNIAPKVAGACWWALQDYFSHIFVCDDDTYVQPARLEEAFPLRQDYVGHMRTSGLFYNRGVPYAQGSAYWLSSAAAEIVAKSPVMKDGIIDDGAVGQALIESVNFVHDYRYEPGPLWNERYPQKDNSVITTHKCLPADMREMHRHWLAQ